VHKPSALTLEIEKAHAAIEANKRACEDVRRARRELSEAIKKKAKR
jgi:hypothetical protein